MIGGLFVVLVLGVFAVGPLVTPTTYHGDTAALAWAMTGFTWLTLIVLGWELMKRWR